MSDDDPITVEMVGIKNEREKLLIRLWWNAAIEAAAKRVEGAPMFANEIRRLKK